MKSPDTETMIANIIAGINTGVLFIQSGIQISESIMNAIMNIVTYREQKK